jgi:hypothetical protein
MSYSGVPAGLYARIRDYAQLLDDVLIALKASTSAPSDDNRQKLANLFLGTNASAPSNLSAQFFQMLLQTEQGVTSDELHEIGTALSSSDVRDHQLIDRLEDLALALENERAGMLARMRGHV